MKQGKWGRNRFKLGDDFMANIMTDLIAAVVNGKLRHVVIILTVAWTLLLFARYILNYYRIFSA